MEDMIFVILFLLSFININIKGINIFFYDYMELKNTNSVKGIFVWLIILSHYRNYYVTKNHYIYRKILNCLGQKMVSLFLFYSGFGIYYSHKKKGIHYTKTLPIKGFIIFIKSQLIIIIFFITNLSLGIKTTLNNYLLSMIFKSNIGNSDWFAFTIISFYFYSFISFRFIKQKYFLGILLLNIICCFHIYFTYNYYYPNRMAAVDNTLCFLFGFYYCLLIDYINFFFMKNDISYFGFLSLIIIIYYYYYTYKRRSIIIVSITNILFSLIIIIITMKVRFNNDFLNLLNSHSYSIYLLQRVVMRIIYYKKYILHNELIRFFFEFITILFITSVFDKYTLFIDKYFKRESSEIKFSFKLENVEEKISIINFNNI